MDEQQRDDAEREDGLRPGEPELPDEDTLLVPLDSAESEPPGTQTAPPHVDWWQNSPPPPARGGGPPRVYAYAGLVSAFVLLFGAAMFFVGWGAHALVGGDDNNNTSAVQAAPTAPTAPPTLAEQTPPAVVNVSADDDPAWGPANAAVTVIEFSDFQCPYCARFHQQTEAQIRSTYGDKIRFVYRDLPLTSIHQFAQGAAEASECAYEQGKFWEYHDLLFDNQTALQVSDLKSYAGRLGLDQAQFDACVDSHKYADEVNKDAQDGAAAGVQGTPSFFINGHPLRGAQPFSAFQQLIDAALAEAQTQ